MVAQASRSSRSEQFVGNDKVLFGIIFGVLGFWLFAQTTLNISPVMAEDLGVETSVMNIAVSITALFSGIFIVVVGGLADRLGRVRMTMIGFILSIVGSLLVGLAPAGALAETILMLGRILQGLSAAFIMPATLALIKAYWDGPARQRAVSLWSMGSWGGSGFAALFGGLMADNVGWRWIFFAGAALSLLGMFMVAGTPESKAPPKAGYKFDLAGVLSFMVFMVALQVFVTQGGTTQDKVRAFARGADDFVQRPFDPGELVARIGAVVRRAQHQARQQASTELRVGDATLSMSDLTFQVGDREPVRLTPTEMQILAHLMQSSGTPVSRKRLIERTWGVDFLHESNRVDVYIRRLREKIEPEPSSPIYVRTVRGVGYVFCPPEKSSSAPPNHEEPARTAAAGR